MKPVFQALFALIVIGAIAALILSLSIDSIVKSGIEDTTSEMLETEVTVGDVSISILDGKGSIQGFRIKNPKGFEEGNAIKMEEINFSVDIYSLFSDTIVVNELRIEQPQLFMEQKADGRNNLKILSDRFTESGGESDTYMVVDHLLVKNGAVTVTADVKGAEQVKAEIPTIEMENIGRKQNNTVGEVISRIMKPIIREAIEKAVRESLIDLAEEKLQEVFQ